MLKIDHFLRKGLLFYIANDTANESVKKNIVWGVVKKQAYHWHINVMCYMVY